MACLPVVGATYSEGDAVQTGDDQDGLTAAISLITVAIAVAACRGCWLGYRLGRWMNTTRRATATLETMTDALLPAPAPPPVAVVVPPRVILRRLPETTYTTVGAGRWFHTDERRSGLRNAAEV